LHGQSAANDAAGLARQALAKLDQWPARYGLVQAKLSPVKVAVAAAVNLPTAPDTVPPLGDKTTDFGFGVCAQTARFGILVGHVRAGYWLNGRPNDTTKLGNMLEYAAVLDLNLAPRVVPQLALSGLSVGQTEYNETARQRTEVSQHVANLLLMLKPAGTLVVRPKVALPLKPLSKGSYFPDVYWGLDIWATFP
jgi:hypothetical protein